MKLLFTDLDATLLDERTYDASAATEALNALKLRGIPVHFCTSKTFAESVFWQEKLGIDAPFVVENGGAVCFKPDHFAQAVSLPFVALGAWRMLPLGLPYPKLIEAFQLLKKIPGLRLRGFSDMDAREISRDSGLSIEDAGRAKDRHFDEPFRMEAGDEALLARGVLDLGLSLSRGGRYFHLTSGFDKGSAVRKLCLMYEVLGVRPFTVALGDSPNDLPMLQSVDLACVVMRQDEQGRTYHHPELLEKCTKAHFVDGVGPVGWNRAVLEWLGQSGSSETR